MILLKCMTHLKVLFVGTRQESAGHAMGGVSAFSRQRQRMRQPEIAEVAAMEELLTDPQFEDAEGDLEDDFVLAATQVGAPAAPATAWQKPRMLLNV